MFGSTQPTQYDLNFHVFNIPVRVHVSFWIVAAIFSWDHQGGDLAIFVIRMLCVLVSILVHELGHALVTRKYGWRPQIVLYFAGGYATTMRHSRWKSVAVTLAGPMAGLALCAIAYGCLLGVEHAIINKHLNPDNKLTALLWGTANFLVFINLIWSVFNLIPVYPMDGWADCSGDYHLAVASFGD